MEPAAIVDAVVKAYNARNADAFARWFADGAEVVRHPDQVLSRSRDELLQHYRGVFSDFPAGSAQVVHRVVLGSTVVQHEQIRRAPDGAVLDAVSIYEVRDDEIVRFEFLSDAP